MRALNRFESTGVVRRCRSLSLSETEREMCGGFQDNFEKFQELMLEYLSDSSKNPDRLSNFFTKRSYR